ncbi:uncharacterized protein [Rutidosis leptorrhynchoides]|uniref:uncharacterized protein n=1 Tax=Rutidosis leptorrhynchoides TaxID=125765 RepID=UPI003A997EE0
MIHKWQVRQRRKAETLEEWKQELIDFPSLFNTNPSDAPVIIEARIANCIVGEIYTDTGKEQISCTSIILYNYHTLIPLASFANDPSWSKGSILLEVVLGKSPYKRTAHNEFLVVKANSQYNVNFSHSAIITFRAVSSTVHGMMKFPTPAGIATLYAKRGRKIECVQINRTTVKPIIHDDASVSPNPAFPDQKFIIGNILTKETREKLYNILAANLDVFAWQVSNMTGVPPHIADHKLNVDLNIPLVCQKKRGMASEQNKFLREEIRNLVDVGNLRKVKYQTWVANSIMVRKPDNTWRMCVDFIDINKACSKNNYPLPEID